jgi:hypothetical protein
VDVRVRDVLTLWADVIRDYASRDYYELVQGYYRPRVTTWIRALRHSLELDQRMIASTAELDHEYDAIERTWVTAGFPLVERQPAPKLVIRTIQAILTNFASAEKVG